jgi:hypothetical protein
MGRKCFCTSHCRDSQKTFLRIGYFHPDNASLDIYEKLKDLIVEDDEKEVQINLPAIAVRIPDVKVA